VRRALGCRQFAAELSVDDASLGVRRLEYGHVDAGSERDAELSLAEERGLVGERPDVVAMVRFWEDPYRQLLDARGAFVVFAVCKSGAASQSLHVFTNGIQN